MAARLLVGCLLFSILTCSAPAAPDGPPKSYLTHCQQVLLVEVDSATGEDVSFSVREVLKGKAHGPLSLKRELGLEEVFKPHDEYVLCWMGDGSEKGVVCSSFLEGIPEWKSIWVHHGGGSITVPGVGSLEKVKEICAGLVPAK